MEKCKPLRLLRLGPLNWDFVCTCSPFSLKGLEFEALNNLGGVALSYIVVIAMLWLWMIKL